MMMHGIKFWPNFLILPFQLHSCVKTKDMVLKIHHPPSTSHHKHPPSSAVLSEGRNKEKDDSICNLHVLTLTGNINCVTS